MRVAADLIHRMNAPEALQEELAYKLPYLPVSAATKAIEDHAEEAAGLLSASWQREITLEPAEFIQVVKRNRGLRPVASLGLSTRALFRALTKLVEPSLPEMRRAFEDRQAVYRAPLENAECTYVVVADVSRFYDFVDHGLVEDQIVAQSGDASTAETISVLLAATMQRDYGLPQVVHPSNILSELVIDIAERETIRRGHDVARYTDDFRIAATSWQGANQALAALDEETRRIGLALNDEKTFIIGRARYEDWIEEPNRRWADIDAEVDVDLRRVGPYADDVAEIDFIPPDEDKIEQAALRALELVLREEPAHNDRLQVEVSRQLASAAVSALHFLGRSSGLDYCKELIVTEPQLTPMLARYLRDIAPANEEEVLGFATDLVADEGVFLFPWQALWLCEPLRRAERVDPPLISWLQSYANPRSPGVVRARAALTLAEKGLISADELLDLYRLSPSAVRPELVLALANVLPAGSRKLVAVERESPINRWITEWRHV